MSKTIGELIQSLEPLPAHLMVYYDFANLTPTKVNSWRSIYAEAALGWVEAIAGIQHSTQVRELLKNLNDSISIMKYTGWKGGEYTYDESTPLHIAKPGDSGCTEINKITFDEYRVIIHTYYNHNSII